MALGLSALCCLLFPLAGGWPAWLVLALLLLWGAALGISLVQGFPSADVKFWVGMLLVQSLPYLAALIMALTSSMPKPSSGDEAA